MERRGICISSTVVNAAFMVWKGLERAVLQMGKRAVVCMCARPCGQHSPLIVHHVPSAHRGIGAVIIMDIM